MNKTHLPEYPMRKHPGLIPPIVAALIVRGLSGARGVDGVKSDEGINEAISPDFRHVYKEIFSVSSRDGN